jgi:hypothetical protein
MALSIIKISKMIPSIMTLNIITVIIINLSIQTFDIWHSA